MSITVKNDVPCCRSGKWRRDTGTGLGAPTPSPAPSDSDDDRVRVLKAAVKRAWIRYCSLKWNPASKLQAPMSHFEWSQATVPVRNAVAVSGTLLLGQSLNLFSPSQSNGGRPIPGCKPACSFPSQSFTRSDRAKEKKIWLRSSNEYPAWASAMNWWL